MQVASIFFFAHIIFKSLFQSLGKLGFLNKRLKAFLLGVINSFYTILTFKDHAEVAFENILGKGENAGNQHFLVFSKCFLPLPKHILIF